MRLDLLKRFIFSSPKKQLNAVLVYVSYFLNKTKPWGMPIRLMVEPANFCNLRCPTCPVGAGEIIKLKGTMNLDLFKKIIDETGDYLFHISLWNWGEPFLNKDLPEMIKYAKEKNIYVITSTNGHFLTEENARKIIASGLDELIIALDGLSQETLAKYRQGADFLAIVNGIKNVVRLRKELGKAKPVIQLQFIAMKHNEHEIGKVDAFARELGIDKVVIKSFGSHLNLGKLNQFEPENKNLSRYSESAKKKNCSSVYTSININYDGNVVPCCYDPMEKHILGNAAKQKIKDIWRGSQYENFRRSVPEKRIDICTNCDYNKNLKIKSSNL